MVSDRPLRAFEGAARAAMDTTDTLEDSIADVFFLFSDEGDRIEPREDEEAEEWQLPRAEENARAVAAQAEMTDNDMVALFAWFW
jgi:hypothetical protein